MMAAGNERGSMLRRMRRALFAQLDPPSWPSHGLSPLNAAICVLILIGTVLAIIETEPVIMAGNDALFRWLELGFGVLFLAEYIARFWVIAEEVPEGEAWRHRLRFVLSPWSLIDLAVVVISFAPFIFANGQMLRLLRLFRILRLAKLGRMSSAMQHLLQAIASRRLELGLTAAIAMGLLVFGATALYWIEGDIQPDKFGSIPRALWWAIITLTTIGYGDVYPVTVLGRIVAAFVAICGIGLIAMPTGILASAFSDAMEKNRTLRAKVLDERDGD